MAVLGMRGTGNFTSVERPENFRQAIGLLFPNGTAPLTAFLSRLKEEATDDPIFHWFEKSMPLQRASVRGAGTSNPPADDADVSSAGTADVYIKVRPTGASSDDASIFKPGHIVLNEETNENLLVLAVDTTNNTIKCRRDVGAKHATNPAITANTTTDASTHHLWIVGNGFPEGASVGQSIAYAPVRHYNYCQIARTPVSLTGTAIKTRLEYDDQGPFRESKREAAQVHATEIEKALLFGEREEITSLTGPAAPLDSVSSGKKLRFTRGIVNWLPTATTSSVSVNTDLNSYNSGILTEAIAESWFEEIFRYGNRDKLCFAGSTALMVLNQLAKNKSVIQVSAGDTTYGFRLQQIYTVFGTLMLYNHPLMSDNPAWRKALIVLDLDKFRFRYVRDTQYLKDRQSPGDDAKIDEYLTEFGLEAHFTGATPDANSPNTVASPCAHGIMSGIASYGG